MIKPIKNLLCFILAASVLMGCIPSFAAESLVDFEVIVDFKDKEAGTVYADASYYPTIDGTKVGNFSFSKKATLTTGLVDDKTAFIYNEKEDNSGSYYTLNAYSEQSSSYTGGLFMYSGKIYTNKASSDGNMDFTNASMAANYSTGGVNDGKLNVKDEINSLEANKWYEFKCEFMLDKTANNIKFSMFPEGSWGNTDNGFVATATIKSSTLSNVRVDFELDKADTFVAYRDMKLVYNKNYSEVTTIVNGNPTDGSFKNGVFTAIGSGSGLFALAVYKNDELISIDYVQSKDELETIKLNTVIENGEDKKLKIFHFGTDGSPYSINEDLGFDSAEETRIYFNEDFSDPSRYATSDRIVISDGRLELRATSDFASDGVTPINAQRPRFGASAYNPGRYIVYEADYSIPADQSKAHNVRLINSYYTSTDGRTGALNSLIRTTGAGQIYTTKGSRTEYFGTLSAEPLNLAIIVDLQENTFDFYVDKVLKKSGLSFLPDDLMPGTEYGDRGFFIGHTSGDVSRADCNGTLIVDNLKIYDGSYFKDIGNEIYNVHHTDYSDVSPGGVSEIYQRPQAAEIAKHVLNSSHPRFLIDNKKVKEIKNSNDPTIISWRNIILEKAAEALSTEPYQYKISGTGSVQNLPESRALMMNLGLAYLITGDVSYAQRAYKEAEVMFGIYAPIDDNAPDTEDNRDYWNSYSCLDVTEISQILSICYDWMYHGLSLSQREAITAQVMEKGINNMFNNYFGRYLPSYTNDSWWDTKNNQGGVCNGSALVTAIVFMEEDAHRCSQIAESAIRALEIVLANFAPDGGWMESASYWAYTLEFVTMACATLDNVCGTNYGLQDAIGLRNSCMYSLSINGETGSMSFGDGSASHTNAPFLFYWATAYKDSGIGAAAMYIKEKFGFTPNAYDLVYYDANYIDEANIPEAFYYKGTEMVSLRSGNNHGESYIVMTGGLGHCTGHDHLDSGHVIVEMNGERVFVDTGAEHYAALGYFGSYRYYYFRARPEGHNIFVINPYNVKDANGNDYFGQDRAAVSTVTDFNSANKTATMDLSAAYARDAQSASRKISLQGKNVVVEDSISLKDTSDIYWNWYVNVKSDKYDTTFTAGNIEISDDGKTAIVTKGENKYKVSIETDADYTLAIEAADYYVDVEPSANLKRHSNEIYRRLSVQLKGVSGDIYLKTTVESVD